MKAMVMREWGPPEVMRLEEIPTPAPGPGEVLIRVHAVSVNRTLDLAVRAGTYAFQATLPHILGVDPSGIIEAVGTGVAERKSAIASSPGKSFARPPRPRGRGSSAST